MKQLNTVAPSLGLHPLVGVVIVVGVLHFARDIFIPVAIAILLSFLLAPLAARLTRLRLPNVAAVVITVLFAFSILGLLGWVVSRQFVNLMENLPRYEDNLQAKVRAMLETGENGAFQRAAETIDVLREEIEEEAEEEAREAAAPEDREPVPVEIQQPEPGPFEMLRQYGQPLLGPLGTAGVTLVFVFFILLQRNDLRDRLVKLVSAGNLNRATQAVDDVTRRITRYLLAHSALNVAYGLPIAAGLYFIGVPNALLWGILATLLRFLPFVGAWIAAVFPITLAFAVDPGWTMPLMAIGLVLVLELFSNNVLEPWLYGTSTGISTVALLFAALVWTWIWGPVGLFLSTPLTVCLLVIGKNAPSLKFLNVLLGSDPVLSPKAQFYQRMLAMDAEALFELADEELEDSSLTTFYDQIVVPALVMAETDRHAGLLAETKQAFILRSMRELIEDLGERHGAGAPAIPPGPRVLCLPALDQADELSARMFVQLLQLQGMRGASLEAGRLPEDDGEAIVWVCAVPPGAVASVRRLSRQLREAAPERQLGVGLWGLDASGGSLRKRLDDSRPDLVAATFADALVQLRRLAEGKAAPAAPAAGSAPAPARKAPPDELFAETARQLAATFGSPIPLVAILPTDHEFWKDRSEMRRAIEDAFPAAASTAVLSRRVAQENDLLVIEDLSRDRHYASAPFVAERGIRFYAGAPLRTAGGHAVGALCVLDIEPREVGEDQTRQLCDLAERLMRELEGPAAA